MVGMDKTFSNEFRNLVACWWHTRTYHLNMVTINRISLIMWQHRPIFPKKNPLYHSQSLFFCHQNMKFCLKNIHWLLVCNGFSLKSTFLCDLNPNLAKSSCIIASPPTSWNWKKHVHITQIKLSTYIIMVSTPCYIIIYIALGSTWLHNVLVIGDDQLMKKWIDFVKIKFELNDFACNLN